MKVGLYFGTFNPVHVGHLIIAEGVINASDLDRVWMVVSPHNPLKDKNALASEYDRFRMAELALEGNPRVSASNVEFLLPQPSYTIDTLTHLRDKYRSYEFSLIMGEDNLVQLPKWKNYKAILDNYCVYVYPRPGKPNEKSELSAHPNVSSFDFPRLDISATAIRQLVKAKKSIRYLVTDKVNDYIEKTGLYVN
jgi:nicotinate-nucleotide adenylyltransferase